VDANNPPNWQGANEPCYSWPWPTEASQEPSLDFNAFPRLAWGICDGFEHESYLREACTLLGFRSLDGDTVTIIPGLVKEAEVIAVGKFPAGSRPFYYRHPIGQGHVYVNAWTNNVFRDSESRHDYGGCEFDFLLSIPLAHSNVKEVDLTKGQGQWLRHTWGYFWKEL